MPLEKPTVREANDSELSSEPKTIFDSQACYMGRPVKIIYQEDFYRGKETYTIQLENGEEIPVLKSKVTLRK